MHKTDGKTDYFTRATYPHYAQFTTRKHWPLLAVSALALLLTVSCGGGSSSNNDAITPEEVVVDDPVTNPVEAPAASIRINEFLASSDADFADEDGDFSDWVELHNTGDQPIDLNGWYITDDEEDLTQWPLPAETIEAGGFLVIFASGKDRGTAAGEQAHTNFKLSSDGDYLALVQADGVTVADDYAPEFPPQTTDVSYGYFADNAVGFLESTTPGAANSRQAVAGVEFSRPAGVFTDSLELTLQLGDGRAGTIFYTIDGSAPTAAALQYDGPITVTQTTLVRARAFDADNEDSSGPDSYAFFTALNASAATVTSELPLVIVDTLGGTINRDDDGIEAAITIIERTDGAASATAQAEYSGGTSIRIRGSSSSGFPKKPFKLELHDAEADDVDVDLLGLGSESDWILYAPGRYDRNMIANPLIQQLAGAVGLVELQSRFVELYVNEDGGQVDASDYRGIYAVSESIKISENRIDIDKLSASDEVAPEITGGYIIALDRTDTDEYNFRTASGLPTNPIGPINVARPKIDKLTAAQQSWIVAYVNAFDAALINQDYADTEAGYRAYIDVDSWIDAHILTLFAKDPDMNSLSHYMTLPRGEKLRSGPLWDYDRAFNSIDARVPDPEVLWSAERPRRPFTLGWWGRLFDDEQFVAQYRARWSSLREGTLATAAVLARIDALSAEIAPAYPREDARWGDRQQYGSRYTDFAGETAALKDWVTKRLTFLDQALNEPL